MIDYKLLGKRISALRKRQGLTQERLAELVGISNNYLSNIENCHSIPSLETVMNICKALRITPNEILLGTDIQSADYLNTDLSRKLAECTNKEKKLINGFIDLLITQR